MVDDKKIEELKERREELKALIEEIEATLRKKMSDDVLSYEIDSGAGKRRVDSFSVSEILKLKNAYSQEIWHINMKIKSINSRKKGLKGILFR